jgi:uncharacterized membrane protein YfcA
MFSLGIGAIVLIGGQIGSRISIKLPEKWVKQMIAVILLIIDVWMFIKELYLIALCPPTISFLARNS